MRVCVRTKDLAGGVRGEPSSLLTLPLLVAGSFCGMPHTAARACTRLKLLVNGRGVT